ncbi:DUF2182 domain-containing protein [Christensenellaceae bacterium OttesenSCG-928-K19]|nr:DUF2182 domain-containing protein [Christensenellaceae bacterium OttesenSCG-928-K19]
MEQQIAQGQQKKKFLSRDQWVILIIVVALTLVAWIYLAANGSDSDMAGMSMDMTGANDPSMDQQMAERLGAAAYKPTMPGFSMFVPMWIIMCIGMMLPTAVPMFFTYHTVSKRRAQGGSAIGPTLLFVLGYVLLWALFGVACWVVGTLIINLVGDLITSWAGNTIGVAAIFLFAGVYQLTPLKNACLKGCQHPLQFVMHKWKEGMGGALLMGMRHGIECIGCCWALMLVLFPLGMMNLFWMGIFTIVMFFEKNAKYGTIISKMAGVLFLIAGGVLMTVSLIGMM